MHKQKEANVKTTLVACPAESVELVGESVSHGVDTVPCQFRERSPLFVTVITKLEGLNGPPFVPSKVIVGAVTSRLGAKTFLTSKVTANDAPPAPSVIFSRLTVPLYSPG